MTTFGKSIFAIAILVMSCQSSNCNWPGGAIVEYGNYCNSEFSIDVFEHNLELRYEVRDRDRNLLVKEDVSISVVQHWGLFMDNDGNFWVFSSDIGDCVWERIHGTRTYQKKTFDRPLTKIDVPVELYESPLRRFLKVDP